MLASGETPPKAITDRAYSGKFMVRVTPESHRQLVIDAAEQNVSLNQALGQFRPHCEAAASNR